MRGHGSPRMVSRIAARASLVMRQREGLGAALVLDAGLAGSTGGRVRDLPGNLFCDQEGNQPCVEPGLCERWVFGCEFVKAGEALHSLEGEFDLPAKPVDREHVARREPIRWK